MRHLFVFVLLAAVVFADDLAPTLRAALVNVQVTSQSWNTTSPWKKLDARQRRGRGFVVEPGVVLTLASVVRDPQMIEISVANSARLYPARLKHADPRIGLALVEITDEELRGKMKPLAIGKAVTLDDEFDIYQLGAGNLLERATARVISAMANGTRLSLRLNTTLSASGDGQVAIRDGRVAGLITATSKGQEATMLSVETIKHYLDDFKDGVYNGCPGPGIFIQPLLRKDLRDYYGLKPDQHGLAASRVMKNRTGDGVLKEGDVLLEVDGFDIDDEGKYTDPTHGRLNASYLFQGRRFAGDTMKAKILRDGEVKDVEFELRPFPVSEMRVPTRSVDGRPEFMVVGGLVILELTGALSLSRSTGGVILRRYKERATWDPTGERKRIVFVDHVLADASNKGFGKLRLAPIRKVDGMAINEIADVAKALEKPQGKFHVFEFEGVESDLVIPVAERDAIDDRIAETYQVSRRRYLLGDPE